MTHTYIQAFKQPTLHCLTRSVRRRAATSKRGYRPCGFQVSDYPTPQKLFVLSGRGLDDLESQLGGLPLELLDL